MSNPSQRQEILVETPLTTPPLVVADDGEDAVAPSWEIRPSRRSVIAAVGRRLFPYLVEATLIPTALFYIALQLGDMRWALFVALGWTYGAVARRMWSGRPVPGLLVLAVLGITMRTIVHLLSHSDFIYFLQPILRTTSTGLVFAVSVLIGRPLIARFAGDFCPLSPEVRARPGVHSLFRRLSLLWAGVNVAAAASSLVLLLTVPLSVFVITAAVSAWIITCTGVVITVADSVNTARREGLVTALSPDGRLYAATMHPATA